MTINFTKYHGTGNDFVMINALNNDHLSLTPEQIQFLCHRRFGIGADGVIILKNRKGVDFEMLYYNSDGQVSSMCGNGARCTVHFAHSLGQIKDKTTFYAPDGIHHAVINESLEITLGMSLASEIKMTDYGLFLDTGSPHLMIYTENVDEIDVKKEGKKIRYNDFFKEKGVNVNFVQKIDSSTIKVRTYERGVEDETYSCGTGVTAAAIVSHFNKTINSNKVNIHTKGGNLKVDFKIQNNLYLDVQLIGFATEAFNGHITI